MRKMFLAVVFLAGACGAPPTGVDFESTSHIATPIVEKKAGKSGGSDRDDPVICIQLRDDEECPALPIGPIIGL